MQIDVFFGPAGVTPADVSGRAVAVIDVLRASTSIAVALDNGARAIIPFENSEDAVSRAKAFERSDVRLAGERKSQPIPGFDLGNSPLQYTREAVDGKTILMATTNGTGAITATQGARDVIVSSYVNFSASMSMLRAALAHRHRRRPALRRAGSAVRARGRGVRGPIRSSHLETPHQRHAQRRGTSVHPHRQEVRRQSDEAVRRLGARALAARGGVR